MMEYLPEFVQRGMRAMDHWVANNVSRQNQSLVMVSLFFLMCLHLVYTKRKCVAMQKEKLKEEAAEKQQKKKN